MGNLLHTRNQTQSEELELEPDPIYKNIQTDSELEKIGYPKPDRIRSDTLMDI